MRLPQQEQALKAEIDDSEEVWVRTLREREQQVVENRIKCDGIRYCTPHERKCGKITQESEAISITM